MQFKRATTQIRSEAQLFETSYQCDKACLKILSAVFKAVNLSDDDRLVALAEIQRDLRVLIASVADIILASTDEEKVGWTGRPSPRQQIPTTC